MLQGVDQGVKVLISSKLRFRSFLSCFLIRKKLIVLASQNRLKILIRPHPLFWFHHRMQNAAEFHSKKTFMIPVCETMRALMVKVLCNYTRCGCSCTAVLATHTQLHAWERAIVNHTIMKVALIEQISWRDRTGANVSTMLITDLSKASLLTQYLNFPSPMISPSFEVKIWDDLILPFFLIKKYILTQLKGFPS